MQINQMYGTESLQRQIEGYEEVIDMIYPEIL